MSLALTRNQLERQAWLLYYNRTLRDQGIISESEYRQMLAKISGIPANPGKNSQIRSLGHQNKRKNAKRYGER